MHDETSNTWLQEMRNANAQSSGWRYLLDSYSPFVRSILRRQGLDENSAADVAQNVMTIVARKLPEFERQRGGAFRTWLRRITINCLRDYRKSKQYRLRAAGGTEILDLANEMEDASSRLTQVWNREHARHVVEQLLQAIKPEFTAKSIDVFRQLAVESRPIDDVAQQFDMTKNACVVARSRVFRRLKTIADELFDEDGLFTIE